MKPVQAMKMVEVLNEALRMDELAVSSLIMNRVPCNDALGDHPRIQVSPSLKGGQRVRVLGLLQAFCEDGYSVAALVRDSEYDEGGIEYFRVVRSGDHSEYLFGECPSCQGLLWVARGQAFLAEYAICDDCGYKA